MTARQPFVNGQGFVAAPPVPAMSEFFFSGTGMAIFAGARLSEVSEALSATLGIEPGVLVLDVPAGTPAADAGLRPGEVIRAVNGVPVRAMGPLRQAFVASGTREVRLTVSARGAPPRIVTMRW
jgi:S1-C subfamily serine protease